MRYTVVLEHERDGGHAVSVSASAECVRDTRTLMR
jgi:hypothetical protein